MSTRETALVALLARIAVAVPALSVMRNETAAPTLRSPGAVCLFDGEAVEETPILSPLAYIVRWRADVEFHFKASTAAARATGLDALLVPICAALAADRTLGGAVEWLDIGAVQLDTAGAEGGEDVGAALLPIEMQWTAYGSPNA